jgi:hypothetical protein
MARRRKIKSFHELRITVMQKLLSLPKEEIIDLLFQHLGGGDEESYEMEYLSIAEELRMKFQYAPEFRCDLLDREDYTYVEIHGLKDN